VAFLLNTNVEVILGIMVALYLAQIIILIKRLPRKIKEYDRRTTD